jgi:hypothetical protein
MWAECDLFWIYSDRIYVDLVIEAPLLLFLIRLGRAGERCVSGARCQCTDVLRLEPQPQLGSCCVHQPPGEVDVVGQGA